MLHAQPTATRTLVWIDAREAIVISWLEDRAQVERLEACLSAAEQADPPEVPLTFVNEVAEHLPPDDDLLILGPAPVRDLLELRVHELDRHRRRRRAIAGLVLGPAGRTPVDGPASTCPGGHEMNPKRIVIMGAAGRDFHDFNVVYRDDPAVEVVAFTATQIPGIADRRYPAELAGPALPARHPDRRRGRARADHPRRADRHRRLRLQRRQPRVRDARGVAGPGGRRRLRAARPEPDDAHQPPAGRRHRRHPDRRRQEPDDPLPRRACSRSRASRPSSSATRCRTATSSPSASSASRPTRTSTATRPRSRSARSTSRISTPAASSTPGVDYEAILREAENEADVILWDGGNNDFPFYRPDLYVVVADPLRAGHELRYHPGETNLRMADVVVINKVDSADAGERSTAVRASIDDAQPAGARSSPRAPT